MSSFVFVTVSGQQYKMPTSMSDSEIMEKLGLNPRDYTFASRQDGGSRHLTFTPKTGTKGAGGTEYTYNGQIYRFESPVSSEEARALIATNDSSVSRATFTATSTGGTFVLSTGTKGL